MSICWSRILSVGLTVFLLVGCDSDQSPTTTTGGGGGDVTPSNGDTGGTGGGGGDGLCSHPDNTIVDEGAGQHGAECISDVDCRYGRCVSSPLVTGGAFSFCTKQCNCGVNSTCSDDVGANGQPATCLRFGVTSYPDEPDTAYCAQICTSLTDCLALSDKYTHCENAPVGVKKICVAR
ncbi:MAG: hypothetical protein VX938_02510 [Myxococcota bacterium]|nr:hypothetical protein [Myxococcota bacterium]MEE2779551.1 hypothetical protein [Myxococcota bacterium]